MAVKVEDSKSKSHTLPRGVPQGRVVGPTYFSIMLHDVQRVDRPGLSISLCADELAISADCPANKNHRRHALQRFRQPIDHIQTYVTCSHKMIDKSHFGTMEIFIYSERRENADYRGEKMIVVSAKIKKLWRVKVNGGESSHFEKNQFKVVRHILGVFS